MAPTASTTATPPATQPAWPVIIGIPAVLVFVDAALAPVPVLDNPVPLLDDPLPVAVGVAVTPAGAVALVGEDTPAVTRTGIKTPERSLALRVPEVVETVEVVWSDSLIVTMQVAVVVPSMEQSMLSELWRSSQFPGCEG
jgi:hypothetical protein